MHGVRETRARSRRGVQRTFGRNRTGTRDRGLRDGVGVKAELVRADPDDVRAGQEVLPPDPAAANDFLNSVSASIGPEATTVERIHLEALNSEDPNTLASVGEQISTLSKASAIQVLDILRRKNARAYVYVLQKGLAGRGQYSGPLSGTLDATTIRAFNAVCSALNAERACAPGPLTRGALLTLGNYVLQPAT